MNSFPQQIKQKQKRWPNSVPLNK